MPTTAKGAATPLNIRVKPQQRRMIEEAARSSEKTVSDFVRDAALREAKNTLLDETVIRLSEADWDRFVTVLDAPARANPRLHDLMSRKPIWKQ